MKNVEILAPGGSKEGIYAAVYSGADAVYTGINRFSARAFADNPTVEEMCEILDFAHLHDKKIYLTANTLLTEDELEGSFYSQIRPLYEAGLDAVIVQDFGVMDFVREHFPGLDIHASTQMSILTGEAAELLKPYGVTRVVPARELSFDEICNMRKKTSREIEVFVHGALCYCYSGQCQMSQVIGGRSGNRGMCAQPCRLPYTVDNKNCGYILSPKDMCTLARVGELIQAGVDSFKIEGRMKKPAYAAFSSYLYRLYADASLAGKTVHDREVRRDIKRLADIYNRGGFSEEYLFEPSKKNIIYAKKNGHYGVCVGEVEKVNSHTVEYRLAEPTYAHDVIEFRNENGERVYEYTLKEGADRSERVTARYKKGCKLRAGQKLYRTKNSELLQEISNRIEEGKRDSKIKLQGVFTAVCGDEVSLELCYRDHVCRVTGVRAEKAEGRPVRAEDIEKRLYKTGVSEFEFERLTVHVPDNVFIPLGSIAALRRRGFEEIRACICGLFRREAGGNLPRGNKQDPAGKKRERKGADRYTIVRVADFGQIEGVKCCEKTNATNTRLHLKLDEFPADTWERLSWETGDFVYYLSLPAVLRTKNAEQFLALWDQFGSCFHAERCRGMIVNSIDALPVLKKLKQQGCWELLAGPGLYCWNRRSAHVYRSMGMSGNVYMAYGRTAVMTTEGCVRREIHGCQRGAANRACTHIRTPKGDEFTAVNYCEYCYNVIYEKDPSWHEPDQWSGAGGIPEIAFSFEHAAEVRKVLDQWNYLL